MAKLPLPLCFDERDDALRKLRSRAKMDRADAWRMLEHMADYVAQDENCPAALKYWFVDAWSSASSYNSENGRLEKWIQGLGLSSRGARQKVDMLEVWGFFQERLRVATLSPGVLSPRRWALERTMKKFDLGRSSVEEYLAKYERAEALASQTFNCEEDAEAFCQDPELYLDSIKRKSRNHPIKTD